MRSKVAALVGFCLVVGAVAGQGDGKGAKEIDGAWTFVSAVKGGKKKDFDGEPIRIVFKAGKMTIDKGGDTKNGSYKIDPAKKPKQIDMKVEENEIKGIYELQGDTLRICGHGQGGERPTEFKADEGSEAMLLTFRREKKK
jgi:uncharacterized protein (TIGR03067 family)